MSYLAAVVCCVVSWVVALALVEFFDRAGDKMRARKHGPD